MNRTTRTLAAVVLVAALATVAVVLVRRRSSTDRVIVVPLDPPGPSGPTAFDHDTAHPSNVSGQLLREVRIVPGLTGTPSPDSLAQGVVVEVLERHNETEWFPNVPDTYEPGATQDHYLARRFRVHVTTGDRARQELWLLVPTQAFGLDGAMHAVTAIEGETP